ncbi:hypothetical protein TcasGA2_TC001133 [Tribolium castaneum]|uniref:Uncharacterized protein n=1 Tax=Tribolium castaneum TaxID=7070 RepID=D6WAB1_TRICA|nr:hypothetical protein TcasGA2_TC001133 [Tribolium castaneum]
MSERKRRWLSKVYSDSQENNTDTDISWSSSDSNSEDHANSSHKRVKIKKWLELHLEQKVRNIIMTPPRTIEILTPDEFLESPVITERKPEDQSPILSRFLQEQSPVISRNKVARKLNNANYATRKKIKNTEWVELHLDQNVNMTPPPRTEVLTRDETLESPVINKINPEDQSPVLAQRESPVITRNKTLRKIGWRSKKIENETRTQIITDDFNSSPLKTQFNISPANTELSQRLDIDPVPSQHVSEVISNDSSSYSDLKALYHQPPPKRKRFKKGSLASQLQKAVNLQSSSTAIWQHEMFLSKSKGEEVRTSSAEEIDFVVLKKWKEYSCTILECRYCKKSKFSVENDRSFLITVGLHNPSNICFEPNETYRIFPPYLTKIVKYELKETLCLIDGCRFISL